MTMHELEVWIKVDESGDYSVGTDAESCVEKYGEEYDDNTQPSRLIKVVIKVPAPQVVDVAVNVPDQPNTATATVS